MSRQSESLRFERMAQKKQTSHDVAVAFYTGTGALGLMALSYLHRGCWLPTLIVGTLALVSLRIGAVYDRASR